MGCSKHCNRRLSVALMSLVREVAVKFRVLDVVEKVAEFFTDFEPQIMDR